MAESLKGLLDFWIVPNARFQNGWPWWSYFWLLFDCWMTTWAFLNFYGSGHKIEQVAKIESLLRRPDLDSSVKVRLQVMECQILKRKSLFARI